MILFLLHFVTGKSQTELGLIPFSNKLHLNPSFAGFNKDSRIWCTLPFSAGPGQNLNHTFSFTYDKWSENLNGGLAFYFQQGLEGDLNTNITGIGFTISKPVTFGKTKQFIPSFNLNVKTATKQWFVHMIDGMLNKELEPPSPPGENVLRYNLVIPRVGLLWNSPSFELGLSTSYSIQQDLAEGENIQKVKPFQVLFHAVQKSKGKRRGLISQPFKATPELTILYSQEVLQTRAGFRVEQVDHVFGLFVQNNYMDNIHGLGTILGWRFNNFRINIAAGGAYSFSSSQTLFFGETSLGLVIPYVHSDKSKPWVPIKRPF